MKQSSQSMDLLDVIGAVVIWVTDLLEMLVRGIAYQLSGQVEVGMSGDIGPGQQHGTAFFDTTNGKTSLPFTVDRPENLDQPTTKAVQSIFAQIERMGYPVTGIEIVTAYELRAYRKGEDRPVFVQRR